MAPSVFEQVAENSRCKSRASPSTKTGGPGATVRLALKAAHSPATGRPVRSCGRAGSGWVRIEAAGQQDFLDEPVQLGDVARDFVALRKHQARAADFLAAMRSLASGERSSCEALASSRFCAFTSASIRLAEALKVSPSLPISSRPRTPDARPQIAPAQRRNTVLQPFEVPGQPPDERVGGDGYCKADREHHAKPAQGEQKADLDGWCTAASKRPPLAS